MHVALVGPAVILVGPSVVPFGLFAALVSLVIIEIQNNRLPQSSPPRLAAASLQNILSL